MRSDPQAGLKWNLCGTYRDPLMRLTDFSLRSLKPRANQYAVLDETLPNFGVRVGTSGRLSFFVLYRQRGRRIRDTLGTYPTITLAEARLLARQRLAQLVLQDENPTFIPTTDFSEAVTAFLETHCAVRNKPRTAAETERLLRRHWRPAFRRRTVQEIRTGDITAVLDALLSTFERHPDAGLVSHTAYIGKFAGPYPFYEGDSLRRSH